MSNDLAVIERELMPAFDPVMPSFKALLPAEIPPERLMRTIMVSCANNPKLMECNRQSLVNSALSAACLGLECDGVGGQGYLVPFWGRGGPRAQFIVGYKGYATIAGRSGRTLEGFVVREGDQFEFDESLGEVRHDRVLGGEGDRRVIAVYAVSRKPGMATMLRVLSDDQVRAIRDDSEGWKSYQKGKIKSTPWASNYSAMARKTVMRELAKDLPMLTMQQAMALETQHDLGHVAYLAPDGVVHVEHETVPAEPTPAPATGQPSAEAMLDAEFEEVPDKPGTWTIYYPGTLADLKFDDLTEYNRKIRASIKKAGSRLEAFRALNESYIIDQVAVEDPAMASSLIDLFVAESSTGST